MRKAINCRLTLPNAHSSEVKKIKMLTPLLSGHRADKSLGGEEGSEGLPLATPATHPARSQRAILSMQTPPLYGRTSIKDSV